MIRCGHLTFSGAFGGREKVAFSLVEALGGEIQARLYLVLEERGDAAARDNLLEHLARTKIPATVLSTTGVFSPKTLKELADALRKDEIQILHSHCHKSMLYALLIKYWQGLSFLTVVTLHGLILPHTLRAVVHHGFNVFGMLFTDGVIGCSKREGSSLLNRFPSFSKKFTVIRNNLVPVPGTTGEASRCATDFRAKFQVPPSKKILVGTASRLTEVKNLFLLLEAAKRIIEASKRNDLLFIIAGDGELRDRLEERSRALGLVNSVIFVGFLIDMRSFYQSIDLFLLTSDSEGTPMTLLEAMSAGLPVIASSVGGIPDIVVHGVTGYLFPKGDVCGCAAAVLDLLEDAGKAGRMGAAGIQRIHEDFSPKTWIGKHLEFYAGLIQKNSGKAP